MTVNNDAMKTDWVDPDDAPELDVSWFDKADHYRGETLVRRGRPKGADKVSTTIRFDADVLAAFKSDGPGWQTRMNQALRDWLAKKTAA